jgi:hypothetical protein
MVMSRIWKEVLTVIEGLLVPPLSDISSDMSPLSDKEVDVVFKWLKVRILHGTVCVRCLIDYIHFQFLRDYFYAGGEGPVSLEVLQNQKYRDIFSIRLYYDWTTCDHFSYLLYLTQGAHILFQGCPDGRMRPHDAANAAGGSVL